MWWLYAHMSPSSRSTSFVIAAAAVFLAGAFLVLVPGCGNSVNALGDGGGGAGASTGAGGTGAKIPVGMTQCSDGIDNDGDGKIDYNDPECVGPLDNDEGTYATGIPGD